MYNNQIIWLGKDNITISYTWKYKYMIPYTTCKSRKSMCTLTSPLNLIVRILNVETGPKILKQHMEHPNMTERHILTNEMGIDLNMFGTVILDRA